MSIIDDMRSFQEQFPAQPRLEIQFAPAAWEAFKAEIPKSVDPQPADSLLGIPVHVDPTMPPGAWKLLADGEVTDQGDALPGCRAAAYIPGIGLIGIKDVNP